MHSAWVCLDVHVYISYIIQWELRVFKMFLPALLVSAVIVYLPECHLSLLNVCLTSFPILSSPFPLWPDFSTIRLSRTACASWGTCRTVWLQRPLIANRGGQRSLTACYVTPAERMLRVQDVGARRRKKRRDMTRWEKRECCVSHLYMHTLSYSSSISSHQLSYYRDLDKKTMHRVRALRKWDTLLYASIVTMTENHSIFILMLNRPTSSGVYGGEEDL